MLLPMPAWLLKMPNGYDKRRARMRFLFRVAALYASEPGDVGDLSSMLHYSRNSLAVYIHRGQSLPFPAVLNAEELVKKEPTLGDIFQPDLFRGAE